MNILSDQPKEASSEKKSIVQQFEEERAQWKHDIESISKRFRKIEDMVEVQVDLYSSRQVATEYVYQLITTQSKLKKMHGAEWKKWYDHYTLNEDHRPSEKEKAKLIDDKISNIKLNLDVIQSHIEYMRETVRTIDQMIFGIKSRNEIEAFRRNI